jgi:hypothetical protein
MELRPEMIGDVRKRFYDFYDGVVCSVRLELRTEPRRCEVVIQTQDRESDSGWSNVQFAVQRVSECRFQIGKSTFEVLSGGLQFGWLGSSVCVVFDAYPDDGPGLPDLGNNIAYVIGASCDIRITPIPRSAIPQSVSRTSTA